MEVLKCCGAAVLKSGDVRLLNLGTSAPPNFSTSEVQRISTPIFDAAAIIDIISPP